MNYEQIRKKEIKGLQEKKENLPRLCEEDMRTNDTGQWKLEESMMLWLAGLEERELTGR